MATFETMKKSLEVLEKNVKVSKSLLGAKVDSLDEMKRNRQEAENDEDRRELKIAIESLETIIDKDRVAVADLEASYKELKEEVDKAEAERVAEADEDHISASPSIPDMDRAAETEEWLRASVDDLAALRLYLERHQLEICCSVIVILNRSFALARVSDG